MCCQERARYSISRLNFYIFLSWSFLQHCQSSSKALCCVRDLLMALLLSLEEITLCEHTFPMDSNSRVQVRIAQYRSSWQQNRYWNAIETTVSWCICHYLYTQIIYWQVSGIYFLLYDCSLFFSNSPVCQKLLNHHPSSGLQTLITVVLHCRPPVFKDNDIVCIPLLNQRKTQEMHGKSAISVDYCNIFLR